MCICLLDAIARPRRAKNTDVLIIAADLCRELGGIRMTSCKSAKDRSGMSMTLEQVRFLQQRHDVPAAEQQLDLDILRRYGVRRDNTCVAHHATRILLILTPAAGTAPHARSAKNTGARAYAFNALQRYMLPTAYQPPKGTSGGSVT
jgi:hypothetical protein